MNTNLVILVLMLLLIALGFCVVNIISFGSINSANPPDASFATVAASLPNPSAPCCAAPS